jgi:diamine N-acetyltransferase
VTTSIRLATPADAPVLAALAADTFALACPPHTTADAIAAFIAANFTEQVFETHLGDDGRALLLAEQGESAVGYSMLVHGEPTDADVRASIRIRPTVELSKFYTRATAHGTGVAAPLMAETLAVAVRRGAAGAWLGVNEENARAQRFYEKSGFTRVGRKHFLVGGRREDDYVMERTLG